MLLKSARYIRTDAFDILRQTSNEAKAKVKIESERWH